MATAKATATTMANTTWVGLGLAGEDQGDVVGLLFGADPGVEGLHDLT
jgi:hypothetical protein